MKTKKCSKCKIDKPIDGFHKRSGGYLKSRCVDCSKEDRKEYEAKNQDLIKKRNTESNTKRKEYFKVYNKKHHELNKIERNRKNSEWCRTNRESINKRNRKYLERNLKNESFRLKENIRNLIRVSIKSNGFKKDTKTFDILGCTIDEFKNYIESMFESGMSWDNYPDWHLDHRVPISWAKDDKDIIRLNHYTNFQPKWSSDNLSKGNKYSD